MLDFRSLSGGTGTGANWDNELLLQNWNVVTKSFHMDYCIDTAWIEWHELGLGFQKERKKSQFVVIEEQSVN